jgi:hypothetical protein
LDVSNDDASNSSSHTLTNGNSTIYDVWFHGANGVICNAIQDV